MRRATCSGRALNDNVPSFPCSPGGGVKPAGAHHTRSHTSTHAGLISRHNICTTAFNRPRLAENNKQTWSVLDLEAERGSAMKNLPREK